MRILAIVGAWFAAMGIAYVLGSRWVNRLRSRARLGGREEDALLEEERAGGPQEIAPGFLGLRLWLLQSGFRSHGALPFFLTTAAFCLIAGIATAWMIIATGGVRQGYELVGALPGATGDLVMAILVSTPWLALIVIASAPWVYVRAKRRARVTAVEQDLPITLELLATLGEAGLGLDASIGKLLDSPGEERPLRQELRLYRFEVLTGLPRVTCLRRLSRRIGVGAVSVFISAVVQAEQVGAGMADVLQRQADDLRNRRRENAMAVAQSVPVKLTFPLVICFLPGIFVTTLGPTFNEFIKLADSVVRDLH